MEEGILSLYLHFSAHLESSCQAYDTIQNKGKKIREEDGLELISSEWSFT